MRSHGSTLFARVDQFRGNADAVPYKISSASPFLGSLWGTLYLHWDGRFLPSPFRGDLNQYHGDEPAAAALPQKIAQRQRRRLAAGRSSCGAGYRQNR